MSQPPCDGRTRLDWPIADAPGGVQVYVRVTPRARLERIDGVVVDADGRPRLKVLVRSAPENGKANKALLALLAKEWRLPKSSLVVTLGATDRLKSVFVRGDSPALIERLLDWYNKRQQGGEWERR